MVSKIPEGDCTTHKGRGYEKPTFFRSQLAAVQLRGLMGAPGGLQWKKEEKEREERKPIKGTIDPQIPPGFPQH